MKVTTFTKSALQYRRQKREMLRAGYIFGGEIDWKINRGGEYNMRVTDVVLGVDGNSYYYKKEKASHD